MFIITEEIRNAAIQCIAGATHANASFSQVNQLIQALQQLPKEEPKAEQGSANC